MAFNFIKKVFSFGRKQAEENEQPAPEAEELKPLGLPEPTVPASQEPQPPSPPQPDPVPAEPQETPDVPPAPPGQPAPERPPVEVPTPAEPAVAPEPEQPQVEPEPEPQPAPAPVEIPAQPAPPAPAPDTPTKAAGEEMPAPPAEDRLSAADEAPALTIEEAPSATETPPSGPKPALGLAQGKTRGGHLPLEGGEDAAATPPSPVRGGSIGEAERGGVVEEPSAAIEEAQPLVADEAPAPTIEETPSTAEATPSGMEPALGLAEGKTRGGHLLPEGGKDAAPTLPSPLRGGSIGEADRGGVAEEPSAVAIATTPPVSASATPSPSAGKVTVSKKVEQKAEAARPAEPAPRVSWFQRLKQGLSRSSKELSGNIAGVFTKRKLDEDTLQDLEDVLIRADLGMETAIRVTDALSSGRYGKNVSDDEVRAIMAQEMEKVLKPVAMPLELDLSHKPHVILVVGVNGTGKTTTIGKLAAKLTEGGLSVTLAAGDTFRAAAIEQLKIWGERTGSPVVSSKLGADAAGLAYDAFEKAKQAGSDVLIIDTAGRLQNKAELMAELEKIVRVLGKLDPEAPHTVLQTVDATTGQNALNQVEIFRNVAGVNGLVMTKLDGTARGGILVAIAAKHKLPVYFIGVGEQVDDLEPFSASDFAKAIAGVA